MRSIAVARMQPLVVAPQSTTVSTRWDTRMAARFVPKNAEAPFLRMTISSGRSPSRGSISSVRSPICSCASVGNFCTHSPPSLAPGPKAIVVKITGVPPSRAASTTCRVASTTIVRSDPAA